MCKKYNIINLDNNLNNKIDAQIAKNLGLSQQFVQYLKINSYDTEQKIRNFLNCDDINLLSNYNLVNIDKAVDRIKKAKINNENILIYGDYDADGICAALVMYYSLKKYGISNINIHIPERKNGYGLNFSTINNLLKIKKYSLIITVDCGCGQTNIIDSLNNIGIDVIVTDHHEIEDNIHNKYIIINPKIKNQEYNFQYLSGAGVAYKLAYALIKSEANNYLDFVAVSTLSDNMPLIGENRLIVFQGLKMLNSSSARYEFKLLIQNNKQVTENVVIYEIAPKINSCGRMSNAYIVVDYFLTSDFEKKHNILSLINEYNALRIQACNETFIYVKNYIIDNKENLNDIIFIKIDNLNIGLLGLIANKITEYFNKPTILLTNINNTLKGSGRSIKTINLYDLILGISDLFIEYGGHKQAIGLTIRTNDFDEIKKSVLKLNIKHNEYVENIYTTYAVNSINFINELELLMPFGVSNEKPKFVVNFDTQLKEENYKKTDKFFKFNINNVEFIDFNNIMVDNFVNLKINKQIIYYISKNIFLGKTTIQANIIDIVMDINNIQQNKYYIFENELEEIIYNYDSSFKYVNNENELDTNNILYVLFNSENINSYIINNDIHYYYFNKNKACDKYYVFNLSHNNYENKTLLYLDKTFSYRNNTCVKANANDDYLLFLLCNIKNTDIFYRQAFNYIKHNLLFVHKNDIINKIKTTFNNDIDIYNIIYALCIFKELNIFYFDDNLLLIYNKIIKTNIDNSLIYKRINELKIQYKV